MKKLSFIILILGKLSNFQMETKEKVLNILHRREIKFEKGDKWIDLLYNKGFIVRYDTDEYKKQLLKNLSYYQKIEHCI